MHLWSVSQCYHSRLPHTSCFDQQKRMTRRLDDMTHSDPKDPEEYLYFLSCLRTSTISILGKYLWKTNIFLSGIWPEAKKCSDDWLSLRKPSDMKTNIPILSLNVWIFTFYSHPKFPKWSFQCILCIYRKIFFVVTLRYETVK